MSTEARGHSLLDHAVTLGGVRGEEHLRGEETRGVGGEGASDSESCTKAPLKCLSSSSKPGGNRGLRREVEGWRQVALYCALFLVLDLCKQLTSYGVKYYNDNAYPVPQTQLVATAEVLKFGIFFFLVTSHEGFTHLQLSFWFAVPALTYAINNNVYYYALHLTTPPVWNVLIQLRVPLTALTYRVVFKRPVTGTQWLALTLLVTAIAATHWLTAGVAGGRRGGVGGAGVGTVLPVIGLALVVCTLAVFGSFVMEYLFKNDGRSFYEMQTQLYFFGAVASWTLYSIEIYTRDNQKPLIKGPHTLIYALIAADVVFSTLVGFVVAVIVKRLDNIVKLYAQALSTASTSLACALAFPDRFSLDPAFLVCLAAVFIAIFLYESNGSWPGAEFWARVGHVRTNGTLGWVARRVGAWGKR